MNNDESIDYESLVRDLNAKATAHRQPMNGTFELTDICNLNCKMCYVNKKPNDYFKPKELSSFQWVDLAHSAVENGMLFLLLTGGEVFLRQDFFEIYTPLTRMGLILTIFTNGTLLTESIVGQLSEAPPNRTEITIYGATAETYESITQVPGSYARCCSGIELMIKYNIPVALKSTLTRGNIHELEAMRKMAQNWGLPFTAGWLLSKRRDGTQSGVEECRLPPSECIDLESKGKASAIEWTEAEKRGTHNNKENFYCQAGRSSFSINPLGEMNGCIEFISPAAKVLEIGFLSAWKQLLEYVDSAPPLAKICQNCESLSFCPRCPAWSFLETGTLSDPVQYLCEIARQRRLSFSLT